MKSFLEWLDEKDYKKKEYKRKEDYCKKCDAYLPVKLNKNGICFACEKRYKSKSGRVWTDK